MRKLIYKLKNLFYSEKCFEKSSLIKELLTDFDKDELSLKRRLYDSLNVLVSSGIIIKIKNKKHTYYKLNQNEKTNKSKLKKLLYLEKENKEKIKKIQNIKLKNENNLTFIKGLKEIIKINSERKDFKFYEVKNLNQKLNNNKSKNNNKEKKENKMFLPFILINHDKENTIGKFINENIIKINSKNPFYITNNNEFIKKLFN